MLALMANQLQSILRAERKRFKAYEDEIVFNVSNLCQN